MPARDASLPFGAGLELHKNRAWAFRKIPWAEANFAVRCDRIAAGAGRSQAVTLLEKAAQSDDSIAPLLTRYSEYACRARRYAGAYRRYCQPVAARVCFNTRERTLPLLQQLRSIISTTGLFRPYSVMRRKRLAAACPLSEIQIETVRVFAIFGGSPSTTPIHIKIP
jgi:hypothetical protein